MVKFSYIIFDMTFCKIYIHIVCYFFRWRVSHFLSQTVFSPRFFNTRQTICQIFLKISWWGNSLISLFTKVFTNLSNWSYFQIEVISMNVKKETWGCPKNEPGRQYKKHEWQKTKTIVTSVLSHLIPLLQFHLITC